MKTTIKHLFLSLRKELLAECFGGVHKKKKKILECFMIKYLTAYLLLGFLVTFNLSNCPVLIYLVACLVLRRLECRACMPDLHTCFPQATRSCRGFNGTDGKDKLRTNFSTTHKLPQRAGSGGSKVHLLPLTQGWCDDQHRLQMLGSISWLRTRADSIGK